MGVIGGSYACVLVCLCSSSFQRKQGSSKANKHASIRTLSPLVGPPACEFVEGEQVCLRGCVRACAHALAFVASVGACLHVQVGLDKKLTLLCSCVWGGEWVRKYMWGWGHEHQLTFLHFMCVGIGCMCTCGWAMINS